MATRRRRNGLRQRNGRPAPDQLHQPAAPQDRWRKLVFGKTSLSLLTLQYLEAEANERGLNHEDLASLPKGRKVGAMSNPELVRVIRKLTKDHAVREAPHGQEPPTGPLLARRNG